VGSCACHPEGRAGSGEWVGTLEGYVNAQISPQVSWLLIRQDITKAHSSKRVKCFFEIDPRPFQAVLDQAKGKLAQAEAQMAQRRAQVKRDIPEAGSSRDSPEPAGYRHPVAPVVRRQPVEARPGGGRTS